MIPACVSAETCWSVTDSGATVVSSVGSSFFAAISAARSASVIGRINFGSCAPLRAMERCGPSRCSPAKPGTFLRAASMPAAITAAVTSGVSVISVGKSAVVPNGACARQIVSMPWTSG